MAGRTLALVLLLLFVLSVPHALGWEGEVAAVAGGSLTRAQYESDHYDTDSNFGPGIHFGVTAVVPFGGSSDLAFESGLLFNQRGGETDFQVVRTDPEGVFLWERTDTYDWDLVYMTWPLSLRYSPSRGNGAYLKAGMEMAFLLKAELTRPVYDYDSEQEPDVEYVVRDDWKNFNFYDVSVLAGAGYEFPIGGLRGFVELSYVAGLRDVLNPKGASHDNKIKNSSINLSVGVLIGYDF